MPLPKPFADKIIADREIARLHASPVIRLGEARDAIKNLRTARRACATTSKHS